MFPIWRLKLREARTAVQNGRYEEASALLAEESLRDFLPARQLAQDVAGKFVERAGDRLAQGDSVAGWQDLALADRLGGQGAAIGKLHREYADRAVAEAQRYLAAGQPAAALARLEKVERRALADQWCRALGQIARLMRDAEESAAHGHFAEAEASLVRAQGLVAEQATGPSTMEISGQLEERLRTYGQHATQCQQLQGELHAALVREDWPAALGIAESLLALAPRHAAARQARHRAWKVVGMEVTHAGRARPGGKVSLQFDPRADRRRSSTHAGASSAEGDTVTGKENVQRRLLWVDAVGGYLVCLDEEVALGQPSPDNRIAVPILADLSRRHAVIRRDGGAYVLQPLNKTKIDGREITEPTVLRDGQLIELGDGVLLRFTKPHALSATARLVLESRHKLQPSVDAVLLMAESCVLGPHRHCHVPCRDWQQDVVLFRRAGELYCRTKGPLTIEGETADGPAAISPGMHVEGEDFSFTLENAE